MLDNACLGLEFGAKQLQKSEKIPLSTFRKAGDWLKGWFEQD